MPIYEYECVKCGGKFDLLRNMADSDKEIKCPKCGAKSAKRLFSMFGTASPSVSCAPSAPSGST
jgi:putative FmdB family regulatory protein